jgi:type II secretory pathway component PulJ
MPATNRGVALLEVLLALVILSLSGLAAIALVNSAIRDQADMAAREQETRTASRVLTALTLLKSTELSQRIGRRALGEFMVNVSRPEPAFYRVALSATRAPDQELLVTVVHRP